MSFCKGGFAKVKDFLSKITSELEAIITEITVVTGKIKDLEADPTVEAIIAVIPGGTAIEGYLNKAIDIITGIDNSALSLAEKLKAWLAESTPAAIEMKVVKLAQVATSVADNATMPQSTYDTAVQVHIEGLK